MNIIKKVYCNLKEVLELRWSTQLISDLANGRRYYNNFFFIECPVFPSRITFLIHSFIHIFIHLFILMLVHSFIYPSIHSKFIHLFIHSHLFIHISIHSFIYSFIHLFIHSFHSFIILIHSFLSSPPTPYLGGNEAYLSCGLPGVPHARGGPVPR